MYGDDIICSMLIRYARCFAVWSAIYAHYLGVFPSVRSFSQIHLGAAVGARLKLPSHAC